LLALGVFLLLGYILIRLPLKVLAKK